MNERYHLIGINFSVKQSENDWEIVSFGFHDGYGAAKELPLNHIKFMDIVAKRFDTIIQDTAKRIIDNASNS